MWPAIACGSLAANLTNYLSFNIPLSLALLVSIVIAGGNILECLLGSTLVKRAGRSEREADESDLFAHPQGVVRFAALAGALSCAIPASLGALAVHFAHLGGTSDLAYLWWTWWTGDVAGIMMIAPTILAWRSRSDFSLGERRLEAIILSISTTLVSGLVFGVIPSQIRHIYPLAYLVMPFLLWAAFRFGRIGASAAVLWVGSIAAWGTSHGSGPFVAQNLNESLLLLQTFMGVVAMTTLVLAGALSEQDTARAQLEARVAARTAELVDSHTRLEESFSQLQESETLRDNLMHMIVHDLRMPLSALQYAMRALTSSAGDMSEYQQTALDVSRQSTQNLAHMIANLLDIHQLESGALALRRQSVPPASLVETAYSNVEFLARYKGLNLSYSVEPGLPCVLVDEEKLSRVLTNLLDNAIRLTPERGTISIATSLHTDPEDMRTAVQFSVLDTGPGIPTEAFARILEKFGHIQSSDIDEKSSSGLGLTFCKMIVEAHGGMIWVQSELGEGSGFHFIIPPESFGG